mgnify:CR=1 FL=1
MDNRFKKIILFVLIISLGLIVATEVFAVSWRPLVPCGVFSAQEGYQKCSLCDIFKLFKNIFDFRDVFKKDFKFVL